MTQVQLYLDMDGVFADFNGGFKRVSGVDCSEVSSKVLWKTINSCPGFFGSLPLLPDALDLWEAAKDHSPAFLTGLPSSQNSANQKREWIARHFGPEHPVHVVPRVRKQDYANPRSILIDDRADNIQEWVKAGGHGILHVSAVKTIPELQRLVGLLRNQPIT